MNRLILAAMIVATSAGPAAAQSSRLYGGGVGGVHNGALSVGTVSTIGGVVGLRMTKAWSIEFEADKGSDSAKDSVFEGLLWARGEGPEMPTPEELERNGAFGRSVWSHSAGRGYSARVVWKTRESGRLNAALFGGISMRSYDSRRSVTITSLGPGVTDYKGPMSTVTTRTRSAGGLTAGLMLPIRIVSGVTVAPELRFTRGLIGDDPYTTIQFGTRLMWGF